MSCKQLNNISILHKVFTWHQLYSKISSNHILLSILSTKKTWVLSSRMEWCIISTFNTTTMSKTHRKLNSSQLPGLGKTRRTCCYWMFCWQWRNQRNSMSKCHSAGQLWPALELHTHTYMFSDCKTLFHYFNFCLLQIHSDTFNHQSSIGACRCSLLFLWVSAKLFCFVLSEALKRDQDWIGADLPPPSLASYVLDDLDAASSSLMRAICRLVEHRNNLETCPPGPRGQTTWGIWSAQYLIAVVVHF